MQGRSLNREERERAEALNANITELKTLHDDCLYGLRSYFDESHALLKYLGIKTDYAYNDDCFYFYQMFIFRLKKLTEEMQFCVMEAQRLETKFHLFSLQYNRRERSAIFSEMETETDAMLAQVIYIQECIIKTSVDFQHLKKEATIVEAN
jgi:hypothetical protein